MKVVILCGGLGSRLREETEYKPKPMVEIGGRPMLWHIMQIYARCGFTEFVLALGYKSHVIKEYFLNYQYMHNDFTVHLADGAVNAHLDGQQQNWIVTLVETGNEALKGARVARVAHYLDGEHFMVTYGDGVADVDINRLLTFHREAGTIGTFTGVRMPSRFGAIQSDNQGRIRGWQEKPLLESYINGGFFVFERRFLDYLSTDDSCELEKEPLEQLAAEGQLSMYSHDGFWHCMDTYRDYLLLNEMWNAGQAKWANWTG
ncbi:glucose-1-phosphate cytidylyltransferase [Acidobacteria bacterium AH-259-D05]|nr:glucose-1-phosphate cytidylyltransferase [Acidobacteria bacterium AH-259-D05]